MYTIPSEYFFRLHHPRPRFKNDVENVLGYMAFSIAQIGRKENKKFKCELSAEIRRYGANATIAQKTIENWRTEIGALFGMYIEGLVYSRPTQLSIDLANTSDLQAFFRGFVYAFQYPAGNLKPKAIGEIIEEGISFHPCRWVFNMLLHTNIGTIDKCEYCHCALNDMRVTRDHESYEKTAHRILQNRRNGVQYDSTGDVVRYACDILDYCVLADLLIEGTEGRFRINEKNRDLVEMIAQTDNFFHAYESVPHFDTRGISALESEWFEYVDRSYQDLKFLVRRVLDGRHPIPAVGTAAQGELLNLDQSPLAQLTSTETTGTTGSQQTRSIEQSPTDSGVVDAIDENDTAKIGDYGENLIWQHECLRVSNDGRSDLVHLIKRIPTHLAVGYDVKSIESDTEFDRFIEVKTTKSHKPLMFNQIHLTPNEWRTAQSSGARYFIYRLRISDEGCKLFVLHDPAQLFRDGLITFVPRDGMDISFTDKSGEEVELLCVH